jgi:hypothetical protein
MDRATFRHLVTYRGPYAALVEIAKGYTVGTVDAGDDVTRTATVSKVRRLSPPQSTPAQAHARSLNWLHFQIAGAVGHLSHALTCGVKLPDPRDDADLREAVNLLTAIRRRQSERKAAGKATL